MSWWVMEERYDSVVHAIHEVGEYGGVRGGALSRWEEGEVWQRRFLSVLDPAIHGPLDSKIKASTKGNRRFILGQHLKVRLDLDYLCLLKGLNFF